MAPGEERAPKIWKTATVAVLLFVTGSVRADGRRVAPLQLPAAAPPPHPGQAHPHPTWTAHSPAQLMIFYGVQALGEAGGRERAVSMCAVGAIAFLPGSYATWHLYGAWRRWPGYSYDLVPSYDE